MFFKYIDYQTNVWYSLVMNGWWNIKLEDIKGLGPKNIKLLNKLNILNMDDLINYYPYRFNVYERSDINTLNQDDKIVIDGIIETVPTIFRINRKLDKMSFKLNISTNLLNVTIFNRSFLKPKLNIGTSVTIVGKYNKRNKTKNQIRK